MLEEKLKNNGIAELSDEELEGVNGGGGFAKIKGYYSTKKPTNVSNPQPVIVKGRPTATLNQ